MEAGDSSDFNSIANLLSFAAIDLLGDDMHIMAFRHKPFGKVAEEDFSTADMRRIEVKAEDDSHYELEVGVVSVREEGICGKAFGILEVAVATVASVGVSNKFGRVYIWR